LIPADEASGYSTGSDTVSLETGFEQFWPVFKHRWSF
jgi:hypothetical protein